MIGKFIPKLFGKRPEVPREVENALPELARLGEQRPHLAELAGNLSACLRAMYAEADRVVVPSISSETAQGKLTAGMPLLRDETLELDWRVLARRGQQVVDAFSRHRPEDAQAISKALHQGVLDPAELAAHVLAGNPNGVHERAAALGLDVSLTASVFWLTLFPALVSIRTALEPLQQATVWVQGHCPICGSFPKLGEFRGLEQTRWLRCGLCSAQWEFSRLRCPYCENRDHRQLGYLHVDGEEGKFRAAICQVCRQYVKMTSTLAALPPTQLLVTDLATIHLDLLTADQGFSQPL